ncbi:hypothetical protein [Paraburkholderia sp.]|uniref:hypothetical protein n=1 Tax=Paraburkholderia sp. TaxID=1926495 RepID=UPI00238D1944|nr:hypothetical protein [Paraburkholderia sp.]MDE1184350.1 hypothetical protein [Paraburkholderia sp.]
MTYIFPGADESTTGDDFRATAATHLRDLSRRHEMMQAWADWLENIEKEGVKRLPRM